MKLLIIMSWKNLSETYSHLIPAHTNEYQKAIWEQVKADKERGPTNPLKIPPPPKRK
jgi:hypothetical protein